MFSSNAVPLLERRQAPQEHNLAHVLQGHAQGWSGVSIIKSGGLNQSQHFVGFNPSVERQRGQKSGPRGLAEAFVRTCQRWRLEPAQQAALLGYGENVLGSYALTAGNSPISTRDVRDRIGFLLEISLSLGAIFDENEAAERKWLKTERAALGGKSALEVMLGGHFADLLKIVAFVRREVGSL